MYTFRALVHVDLPVVDLQTLMRYDAAELGSILPLAVIKVSNSVATRLENVV